MLVFIPKKFHIPVAPDPRCVRRPVLQFISIKKVVLPISDLENLINS